MLQWEIYDAYIADQDKQRAQEELNKQKAAAKKATTVTETAETSQEPAKARQAPPLLCMLARYCHESVHDCTSILELNQGMQSISPKVLACVAASVCTCSLCRLSSWALAPDCIEAF